MVLRYSRGNFSGGAIMKTQINIKRLIQKSRKERDKKINSVMHYKAAVAIFRQWLAAGYISPDEFIRIDDLTASKYGFSVHSIYRESILPCAGEIAKAAVI